MDCLTGRMVSVPILSAKRSISIGIMVNFDRYGDGHGDGDGTRKQALTRQGVSHLSCSPTTIYS